MTRNRKGKRIISFLLAAIMVLSLFPAMGTTVEAESASAATKVADASTMNDWTKEFPITGTISTQNAGGVWTDKSVFVNNDAFKNVKLSEDIAANRNANITLTDEDGESFLVALSAIASNSSVSGMASAPTDTMIILDLSSSMYGGAAKNPATVRTMIDSVNDTIKKLQELNPNNRVGVTIYYGGGTILNNTSTSSSGKVLLPLDRYSHASSKYLAITTSGGKLTSVKVNSNVKNSANKNVAETKHTTPDIAGTYAQLGILHAMSEFMKADPHVPATASYQAGVTRTPVFVFMSDGEPTAATAKFTQSNQTSQMGNNRVADRNPMKLTL